MCNSCLQNQYPSWNTSLFFCFFLTQEHYNNRVRMVKLCLMFLTIKNTPEYTSKTHAQPNLTSKGTWVIPCLPLHRWFKMKGLTKSCLPWMASWLAHSHILLHMKWWEATAQEKRKETYLPQPQLTLLLATKMTAMRKTKWDAFHNTIVTPVAVPALRVSIIIRWRQLGTVSHLSNHVNHCSNPT